MKKTLAAALLLGAATVAGFAPFDIFPLPFATLVLLFMLWRGAGSARYAALIGFVWGLGFFLTGVSWIYVSLHDVGEMALPLAAAATLLFCGCQALVPALTGYGFKRLGANSPVIDALLLAGLWTLGEWLRGANVAGFPWLSMAYSQTGWSPLAGYAPILGSYGMTFLLVLMAALVAFGWWRGKVLLFIAVLLAVGSASKTIPWTRPTGSETSVSLLQGNIPQGIKWDPKRLDLSLDTYRRLAKDHPAQLVVLPETAIPLLFDEIPASYLQDLNGPNSLLMGTAARNAGGRYANAAIALTGGSVDGGYAKSHLVPFGEYVPPGFAWFFDWVRIPMTNFEPGQNQKPLSIAGLKVAVNICYEDAFGEEIIRQLPEAEVLINLSNTAWFGHSLAQPQHLQMSRMRAMETGRPMLRATNTGMTAAIDPKGRVTDLLPEFEEGALTVEVQGYAGATPFVLIGNCGALLLALLAIMPALMRKRQRTH